MTALYDVLAPVLGTSSAILLLVLAVLILLNSDHRFRVVLVYVCWELFATIGLTFTDLTLHGTSQQIGVVNQTAANALYARLYWTNDVIVDLLRFVLTTVLIYKASGAPNRTLGRVLSGLVVAMVVLPFVLFDPAYKESSALLNDPHPVLPFGDWILRLKLPRAAWFNSTSQLLNFGAAILNVILWGALIRSKKRDPQILEVSIGLGILVTGTAVSYGLRHFSMMTGDFTATVNLFLNLTQIGAWLIWCHAFWPRRASLAAAPSP
ncbi:MAG TPA: hypothetical protein VMT15_03665 [Bryobacteraceae bacterium]|nr:hypothetical protein [Bryobacteraceae bacterium]